VKKHPPSISVTRARELRRNATEAELRMKWLLKEHFSYARFRFQVPIRHFIADFASHRYRLIIEIDGGQHGTLQDIQRTQALEEEGYRVVRFWNNDVLENAEGCFQRLQNLLPRDHPHPASTRQQAAKSSHPSPIKGEELQ
jgi:very-short-patch-repair endonuclease